MKKGLALIVVGLLLWIGNISASWAGDKPIVLRYADHAPRMVRTEAVQWWIKKVEKNTGGRVKFEVYLSGSLAKAKDMPEAVRTGITDIGLFVVVYYPSKLPAWTVADIGSVTNPYAVMMAQLDLYESEPAFQKDLAKWNGRLLFPQSVGETAMVFRPRVTNLEDFKGKKIRAVGNQAEFMKALGAVPVPVPHPEIYTALQRGTLDGALGFPFAAMSYKYYEVTKYWLRGVPGNYSLIVVINQDSWNRLPEDIQKVMLEVGREQVRYYADAVTSLDNEIIDKVQKEYGIKVYNLSPEDSKRWRALYTPIWKKWQKEMADKGIPGERILKRYLELTKKYEAK